MNSNAAPKTLLCLLSLSAYVYRLLTMSVINF
jgi:hypothetical protein